MNRLLLILFLSAPFFCAGQSPVISSFSPTSGGQSTAIIITGSNFTGATSVTFGGVNATFFSVLSSTQIRAFPGAGANGAIEVTTPAGASSLAGFTFTGPIISSFSPTTAPQGATVTINGSNFTGALGVRFGGIDAASYTVVSDNVIEAVVAGGTSGTVTVGNTSGSTSMPGFVYTGPIINSFTPTFANPGTTITISGQNFTGATSVDFGGMPAVSFAVLDDATISAVNGIGNTGSVRVTSPNGSGIRGVFVMKHNITSFSPASGPAGASVTIQGSNFGVTPASNIVMFGAVRGTVTSVNSSSISVNIPAGASFQPLSVATSNMIAYAQKPFVQTFTGGGGSFTTSSFASPLLISGGSSNNNPAIADLNGDGKSDILTVNSSGNTFSVFRNTTIAGNASFATEAIYTTGSQPAMIACDDLNGDGKRDIIIPNMASNTVSIFANLSTTSSLLFSTRMDVANGTSPRSVAVTDIDKNGAADIIVVNGSSNSISIYPNITPRGTSYPFTFAPKIDIATGSSPSKVAVADFDNDGWFDIAVTNTGSATVSVFKNSSTVGAISFAPKIDFATAGSPVSLACGDLDGDGNDDIVVANTSSSSLSVFKNTSSAGVISFNPKVDFSTRPNPSALVMSDINGDSKPDLAFLGVTQPAYSIYHNTSVQGTITLDVRQDYGVDVSMNGIAAADVNMDSKTDIILGRSFSPLYYRNKIGESPILNSFSPASAYMGDSLFIYGKNLTGVTDVKVAGVSLDSIYVINDTLVAGIIEKDVSGPIIAYNQWGSDTLTGLSVTTVPRITSFSPVSGPAGTVVTISGSNFNPAPANTIVYFGTVKGIVLSASSGTITVQVPKGATYDPITVITNNLSAFTDRPFNLTFPGAGTSLTANSFAPRVDSAYSTPVSSIYNVWGVAMGDFNSDDRIDVSVAGYTPGMAVFKNTGDSGMIGFAPKTVYNTPYGARELAVADLNRDGKLDVLVGVEGMETQLAVHKNTSSGSSISFASAATFPSSTLGTSFVGSSDIDGDGRPDVVTSTANVGLKVYRNISFDDSIRLATVIHLTAAGGKFCLGDFDGDGKTDIAAPFSTYIRLYRNISVVGRIKFAPAVLIPSGGNNVVSGDLDGDGKLDMAIIKGNSTVSVLLNGSSPGNVIFSPEIIYPVPSLYSFGCLGDIDGDGKADIVVAGYAQSVASVLKNVSVPGTLSFLPCKNYPVGVQVTNVAVGDMDGDGKPDIAATNFFDNTVSFLRNKIGEAAIRELCPVVDNTTLTMDLSGSSYQWQVNTGTGFTNVINNTNYTGSNTATLQLNNIPSSWYGYVYRCIVDGNNSEEMSIRFVNRWIGAVSSEWENPANWSCQTVPDMNTDVYINTGTTINLGSNTTVRSMHVRPGSTVTVLPGYTLTILY